MIGVIARRGQVRAVEESFELLKTPWEWFKEGRAYEVVIAPAGQAPLVVPPLLVLTGSEEQANSKPDDLQVYGRLPNAILDYAGQRLPIYGQVLTFVQQGRMVASASGTSAPAVVVVEAGGRRVLRVGYDWFAEIASLLSSGQPVDQAAVPTLDLHIELLRSAMIEAGVAFAEITPSPAGSEFAVCLTHDIDFVGIRPHKFDHTMWGFLYRATAGVLRDFCVRRATATRLLRCWGAAASLPLVYLGWCKDFWEPFAWYLHVEKGLGATYFLMPFKGRMGEKVTAAHPERRATGYDVGDVLPSLATLRAAGCEVGVHGLDAWHSVDRGRAELKRVAAAAGEGPMGVRMHWLLQDDKSFPVLEAAGYAYDSTAGYNETVGYRCGTTQVFRPLDAQTLLELPLHIQDGALFYPKRMNLTESQAQRTCEGFIERAQRFGGVLTLLWHDRSHGPERFWGDFYADLVKRLKRLPVWFGTASQVVSWFRARRGATFEEIQQPDGTIRLKLRASSQPIEPQLRVRVYRAEEPVEVNQPRSKSRKRVTEVAWDGQTDLEFEEMGRCDVTEGPCASGRF
jgi:hypothetical protein